MGGTPSPLKRWRHPNLNGREMSILSRGRERGDLGQRVNSANRIVPLAIPLVALRTGAVFLPTTGVIALLARAKQKQDYAKVSILVKVVMLLGILSIPAFYSFSKMAQ